jgi:hypothetical protein
LGFFFLVLLLCTPNDNSTFTGLHRWIINFYTCRFTFLLHVGFWLTANLRLWVITVATGSRRWCVPHNPRINSIWNGLPILLSHLTRLAFL